MTTEEPRRPRSGLTLPAVIVGILIAIGAWVMWLRPSQDPASDRRPAAPALTAAASFLGCSDCHGDMDRVFKEGELPNLTFTHEQHFSIGVSDCAACHPANTHEPDRINVPTMSMCFMCHGVEETAAAPGRCSLCHPKDMPQTPQTHLTGSWLPNEHAAAALVDRIECVACHEQKTFCDACHGIRMPHPSDWDEGNHETRFFEDRTACQRCHVRVSNERDFCDSCHHPRGAEDAGWLSEHPRVVTESGAFTCFECHSPQTCSTCHIDGVESYDADAQMHRASPSPSTGAG